MHAREDRDQSRLYMRPDYSMEDITMITAFRARARVQPRQKSGIKTGVFGVISDRLKSWDWRIPGYLGDGFYEVIIGAQPFVVHEDDIELAPQEQSYHGA